MKFCGFVIGAQPRSDQPDWPEAPAWVDGVPAWMGGEEWAGHFIAAFPSEAAEQLGCADLTSNDPIAGIDGDLVRELFDVEASEAEEAWDIYRSRCIDECGFDPGEGEVMFVTGVVAEVRRVD